MPIYEFKCKNCGKIFEELIKNLAVAGEVSCIYCQSKNVKKIVSKFSIGQGNREVSNIKDSSSSKCSGCSATSCSGCGI